ncbi:MAG: RNA methyltransferase [Deltaproteobacteria bacterium]|nr:RNA methyltransferase [Deltaproteobacteria bacterium]
MSEPVIVEIASLAAGGDGVGRLADGRIVFVPWTAPGDRVELRLREEKKRFARGELRRLVEPGTSRREAPCPVAGVCGGCRWQHVDYPAQREAKATILRDAVERIAGLPLEAPPEIVPSPEFGYRARARIFAEGGRIGFRELASHDVAGVAQCPVLTERLNAVLGELAGDPPSGPAEWLLAEGDDETLSVRTRGPGAKAGPITLRVGEDSLRVGPGVFFQANAPLRGALVEAVLAAAGKGGRAVELYAGAGFFTAGLARAFLALTAVESDTRATRDLRHNLAAAGQEHVSVRPESVEAFLSDPRVPRPEVVVLDPPRVGLPRHGAPALASLGARRIVYVSCDPATLARDLKALTIEGYELNALRGFDLFPQTSHIEAVATLER